jgi:tricorn protease
MKAKKSAFSGFFRAGFLPVSVLRGSFLQHGPRFVVSRAFQKLTRNTTHTTSDNLMRKFHVLALLAAFAASTALYAAPKKTAAKAPVPARASSASAATKPHQPAAAAPVLADTALQPATISPPASPASPSTSSSRTSAVPTAPSPASAPQPTSSKLLRYPDIHGAHIVFSHGGDLWKVPTDGGTATRLTAHPGVELFPKFSPDGKWIAFTGQYDGDEQVYVIPADGGVPRQLTFYPATPASYGADNLVYGWTPDSQHILFRSLRDANAVTELGTLYTVPLAGGLPKKVGVPTAGAGAFSPDATKLVYTPVFRDFRSWKRYQGGMAQHLQIYDLKTKALKRLDNNPRTEREPIWIGDKIFFTSDRTGTMNIFEYDTVTGKITQRTHEKQWDIRWASGGDAARIVYELAGQLVLFDTRPTAPAATRFRTINVNVPHDGLATRPTRIAVGDRIEFYAAAPGGKRLAIAARGDVFTAPVEKGFPRNLTNTANAHERAPVWSPDGKTLAYVSDISGEDQIHLRDAKGDHPPRPRTTPFNTQLATPAFSPNGTFLTITDAKARLWLVPLRNHGKLKQGTPHQIAIARHGGRPHAVWSPCGGYIAYALPDAGLEDSVSRLHIYEVATGRTHIVTDPFFDIGEPAWDPAGNYLYYLSRREFGPQYSTVEWNFATTRDNALFALALRKDVPNPFGPQFDDETTPINTPKPDAKPTAKSVNNPVNKPTAKADAHANHAKAHPANPVNKPTHATAAKAPGKPGKHPAKPIAKAKAKGKPTAAHAHPAKPTAPPHKFTRIDWDGLATRVVRLPLAPDNYHGLTATDKYLYYVKSPPVLLGRHTSDPSRLYAYDLKERKEHHLADTSSYSLAPDNSKILYSANGNIYATDPKPGAKPTHVRTDNLYADSVPALEWEEMFNQTWRKFRDHFYVENMHGYDWAALGRQYRTLLPHITHRSDLTHILRELVGELNIGHAYIMGGEYIKPRRPTAGLPGATIELNEKAARYQITKIYEGTNAEPKYRSPLTEVGVNANPGDYILAIDGIELTANENPYRLLRDRTDPITLTLNAKPTHKGARKVTYLPIASERNLRYLEFTQNARRQVEKATNGRVGYLHIPNMGGEGAYEFIKWYYPQLRKEGLVIDVRTNGGGNISQWIIMRLNQKLLGTRFGGTNQSPDAYPANARHGHQVCLINESAGSDGDIFPHNFRAAGLGPLIGKRTWGGVVGISGVGPLLDGGTVFVPLRGTNDVRGNWIIEGRGVAPDIEVENDPKSMTEGRDLQLERGIAEVLKRMDAAPKPWPTRPADPIKTK